jgi:hypothetical protein
LLTLFYCLSVPQMHQAFVLTIPLLQMLFPTSSCGYLFHQLDLSLNAFSTPPPQTLPVLGIELSLVLARQKLCCLSHAPSPFTFSLFFKYSLTSFCLGWPQTIILPFLPPK